MMCTATCGKPAHNMFICEWNSYCIHVISYFTEIYLWDQCISGLFYSRNVW